MTAKNQDISASDFKQYQAFIYKMAGISYPDEKQSLLANRLRKRLSSTGIENYSQYLQLLKSCSPQGKKEVQEFLDAITTNETYFFRCDRHWQFFRDWLETKKQELAKKGSVEIRIWSAAASTGAEAYTMAIAITEAFGPKLDKVKLKIIGTDLNMSVLAEARAGVYSDYALRQTDPKIAKRFFTQLSDGSFQVQEKIRKMVSFEPHNLMQPFRKGPFDFVFLRNVMIYFDAPSKERVLANCHSALVKDGLLMLGESESLLNLDHMFKYMKPSIFSRCETKEEAVTVGSKRKPPAAKPRK